MQVLAVPWVQLPGQQNILVQAVFTESDYAVRVTDLQNIWGEDLKRKGIQERAKEVYCPIDAESNLVDLLKKLQDALTVDSKKTSIVLTRHYDTLTLQTTELIGSTELEWSFRLEALPFAAVATGLTLSLFSMMTFYQREIQSLLTVLEDKDAVIHQMNEFMKSANLVFKPNRRQKAFHKFNKVDWLRTCREKASDGRMSSQEVVDDLSLLGRDADFRKDWKAVLSDVGKWDIKFLPDNTERTPGRVTSSIKSKTQAPVSHDPFAERPQLDRDDTESQKHVFVSPQTQRFKDKEQNKIHTKWSSPVSSVQKSSDAGKNSDDDFEDNDFATPEQRKSASPDASPTLKRSKVLAKREDGDLTLPIYKLKDNRESQELEADLNMDTSSPEMSNHSRAASSSPVQSKTLSRPATKSYRPESGQVTSESDDTTDDSDDDLDVHPMSKRTQARGSQERKEASSAQTNLDTEKDLEKSIDGASNSPNSITTQTSSCHSSQASPKSIKSQGSQGASRKRGNGQFSAQSTPKKARVLNLISPKKSGALHGKAGEHTAAATLTISKEKTDEDSQGIDPEAERRMKAMEKRREAETLMKAPAKKRARKF